MRRACAGLTILVLALAGCGGNDEGGGGADTGTTTEQTTTETTETSSGGTQAGAGRQVFTENCAGCHTLADAEATGERAPNLDEVQPSEATVERQVTNGGGGMPAFGDRLSQEQISAVSQYVASVAGQ